MPRFRRGPLLRGTVGLHGWLALFAFQPRALVAHALVLGPQLVELRRPALAVLEQPPPHFRRGRVELQFREVYPLEWRCQSTGTRPQAYTPCTSARAQEKGVNAPCASP